ncbi:NTP transferase domain-containing protein [Candidatus Woesearchaeota archaeon]|nr:NTP transferase domain-containing protein [Candidatus Woesearchaeota archaeon]
MVEIYAIILAGGRGERFWPKSRASLPKQCLKLFSEKTLIEETIDRLKPICSDFYISTNNELSSFFKQILPNLNYVIEPLAKNTAACIALSALYIAEKYPDATLFIETTDHVYKDVNLYLEKVKKAVEMADKGYYVQLGIKPLYPETGFGYIELGENITDTVYKIKSFREKPNLETAKAYLETGNYLWNSGMYAFKISTLFNAIKEFMPALYQSLMRIKESCFSEEIIKEEFEKLESISIDIGISEKVSNNVMVKADMPWDDIGDWRATERFFEQDKNNNTIKAPLLNIETTNSIIFSDKPVATIGIDNLVIVNEPDCLLVCSKDKAQNVKKILELIKQNPKYQHLL